MKKAIKILIICAIAIAVIVAIYTLAIDLYVKNSTADRIIDAQMAADLTDVDCIVVLGCQVRDDGSPSHMLLDRVERGVELYKLGVSPVLFMSGDNLNESYDETGKMKEIAATDGVPENAIKLDPLGLSTYDSIWRLKELYGAKRIVIVTQEYHLHRALYIAGQMGVEAWGVSADPRRYSGQLLRDLREIVARNKDFIFCKFVYHFCFETAFRNNKFNHILLKPLVYCCKNTHPH